MFNAILYLFLSGGIEDVYEQSAFEYVLVVVWLLAYCSCIALERGSFCFLFESMKECISIFTIRSMWKDGFKAHNVAATIMLCHAHVNSIFANFVILAELCYVVFCCFWSKVSQLFFSAFLIILYFFALFVCCF
jgi:hypothetical protein